MLRPDYRLLYKDGDVLIPTITDPVIFCFPFVLVKKIRALALFGMVHMLRIENNNRFSSV